MQQQENIQSAIQASVNDPRALEILYRNNKAAFQQAFKVVYPAIKENPVAQSWHERFAVQEEEISWGTKNEWMLLIAGAFLTALIIKIPFLLGIDQESFLSRSVRLAIIPYLLLFLSWKKSLTSIKIKLSKM